MARTNTNTGGGGGGGITSINGDTTAAQLIVAGAGITVSTSAGTTTITNTNPTSTLLQNHIFVGNNLNVPVDAGTSYLFTPTSMDVAFSGANALHVSTAGNELTRLGYDTGNRNFSTYGGFNSGKGDISTQGLSAFWGGNSGMGNGANADRATGVGVNTLVNNTGSQPTAGGYHSMSGNAGNFSSGFAVNSLFNNTGNNANGFGLNSLNGNSGNRIFAGGNTTGFANIFNDLVLLGDAAVATKNSQFVVGSAGNPISNWKINGVEYVMPSGAYVAGGALTDVAGNGTLSWVVPGGSGGMAIGGTVTGGTDPSVLFISGGLLAQDPTYFKYDHDVEFLVDIDDGGVGDSFIQATSGVIQLHHVPTGSTGFTDLQVGGGVVDIASADITAGYSTLISLNASNLQTRFFDTLVNVESTSIADGTQYLTSFNNILGANSFNAKTQLTSLEALIEFENITTGYLSKLEIADTSAGLQNTNITSTYSSDVVLDQSSTKLRYLDITGGVSGIISVSPSGISGIQTDSTTYTASLGLDPGSASLQYNDLSSGTSSQFTAHPSNIFIEFLDGTGITNTNTLNATQNTSEIGDGTTFDSKLQVTSTGIVSQFQDITNGLNANSILSAARFDIGWQDSVNVIGSDITGGPINITISYNDVSNNISGLIRTGSVGYENQWTDGTVSTSHVANASEDTILFDDGAGTQSKNTLDANQNTSLFTDGLTISQVLISPTMLEITSNDSISANTYANSLTQTSGGTNIGFFDVGGNTTTNVALTGSAVLALTNGTSNDITGFEAQDLVATIGILNGGGSNTTLKVDDTTQTYILNKLGGSGNKVVTVNNTGVLGTNNGALPHTIFTPVTGGTVNLANNNFNAINPAGAILALTINFPSSPADNDVVEVKFDKGVTTVSYTGGTVVGGITTAALGDYVKFTYDTSTTTWY